jgi:hypothetical protein
MRQKGYGDVEDVELLKLELMYFVMTCVEAAGNARVDELLKILIFIEPGLPTRT